MSRWPPTLTQSGATECLACENWALAERADAPGRHCELQLLPAQTDCFPFKGRAGYPRCDELSGTSRPSSPRHHATTPPRAPERAS